MHGSNVSSSIKSSIGLGIDLGSYFSRETKMGKTESGNNINLIHVVFIIELRRNNSNIDE
jgi:hypothetical protein